MVEGNSVNLIPKTVHIERTMEVSEETIDEE